MENLSWDARLARSNINILDFKDGVVFFEYQWRFNSGDRGTKWSKNCMQWQGADSAKEAVYKKVQQLRAELEQ